MLFRGIGRPQVYGGEPPMVEHPWMARKKTDGLMYEKHVGAMRWPVRERDGRQGMHRSFSTPYYGEGTPVPEDPEVHEVAKIKNPGGTLLNFPDSVILQRMKNEERNKGTFSLFSGQSTFQTTSGTTHNMESIYQEPAFPRLAARTG